MQGEVDLKDQQALHRKCNSVSSASSMANTSEHDNDYYRHKHRSLQYEFNGPDFASRLRDHKSGISKIMKKAFPAKADIKFLY